MASYVERLREVELSYVGLNKTTLISLAYGDIEQAMAKPM